MFKELIELNSYLDVTWTKQNKDAISWHLFSVVVDPLSAEFLPSHLFLTLHQMNSF